MNEEVKKLWTDALESGEYPQGYGALRSEAGYCCLGVLCELAAARGICNLQITGGMFNYDGRGSYLPNSVMHWAGLDVGDPTVIFDGRIFYLSELNDAGKLFSDIAQLIKEQL